MFGYWTPRILIGANGEVDSYALQQGSYIREGNMCCYNGYVAIANKGSAVGYIRIGGFLHPVHLNTPAKNPATINIETINTTPAQRPLAYLPPDSEFAFIQLMSYGSPSTLVNMNNTNLTQYSVFSINVVYITDANVGISDILIKGDSLASGDSYFGKIEAWGDLSPTYTYEKQGVSGATLDYLSYYNYENRSFDKVILLAGANNVKNGENANDIIAKYQTLFSQINAVDIYCVSVPPVNHTLLSSYFPGTTYDNARAQAVNAGILNICGQSHYIDYYSQVVDGNNECSSVYTADGLHPKQAGYDWIVSQILAI